MSTKIKHDIHANYLLKIIGQIEQYLIKNVYTSSINDFHTFTIYTIPCTNVQRKKKLIKTLSNVYDDNETM